MTAPTVDRRRSIALSELWHLPTRIPVDARAELKIAADKATAALLQLAQEALGAALAKFQHMAFAQPAYDDFSIELQDLPLTNYQELLKALESATTVISARKDLTIDQTPFVNQQNAYGSMLIKGFLQGYSTMINDVIGDGIAKGMDREQIKDSLLNQVAKDFMPEWRARLIAQTEVIRSYNGASFNAMAAVEAEFVKWLDGQPGACADCKALDGVIIPFGKLNQFVSPVRGLTATYPPLHPGCRCSISVAEPGEYANQPLLDQGEYLSGGKHAYLPKPALPGTDLEFDLPVAKSFLDQLVDEWDISKSSLENFYSVSEKLNMPFEKLIDKMEAEGIKSSDVVAKVESATLYEGYPTGLAYLQELSAEGKISDTAYVTGKYLLKMKTQNALGGTLSEMADASGFDVADLKAAADVLKIKFDPEPPKLPSTYEVQDWLTKNHYSFAKAAEHFGIDAGQVIDIAGDWTPTPVAPHPTAAAADAFKKWHDAYGGDLTGVKAMQAYAKYTGQPMAKLSAEIKAEGYELKTLINAPKGELPAPDKTVKPNTIGKVKPKAQEVPSTLSSDFKASFKTKFKEIDAPGENDPYWNEMEQTGSQKGSNEGGFFTGSDGQQWYLKKYKNAVQGPTEIFAQKIYDLLGLKTPDAVMMMRNGERWYASKIVEGATSVDSAWLKKYLKDNPEIAAKLHIASAFTQNWDVIGQSWDNIMKLPNGELIVVDVGGTFNFRAQGGHKSWDTGAADFDSLLSFAGHPPSTAVEAFKGLYSDIKSIDAGLETARWLKQNANYIVDEIPSTTFPSSYEIHAKIDSIIKKLEDRRAELTRPKIDWEKEAPDWMAKSDLDIIQGFRQRVLADAQKLMENFDKHAATLREWGSNWGGTSHNEMSYAGQSVLASIIHGIDPAVAYADEYRRMHQREGFTQAQYDELVARKRTDVYFNQMVERYREGFEVAYAITQHELMKLHPDGKVKLYRGVRDQAEDFARAFRAGNVKSWDQNWLASFSLSEDIARNFAGGHGIVIELEVPIEMVFAGYGTKGVGAAVKQGHPHEQEYLVLSGLSNWQLTPRNVHVQSNSYTYMKFAEARAGEYIWGKFAISDLAFETWVLPADQQDWLHR